MLKRSLIVGLIVSILNVAPAMAQWKDILTIAIPTAAGAAIGGAVAGGRGAKVGAATGLGVGTTAESIRMARRDATAAEQQNRAQEREALQEVARLENCPANFPLRGKVVVVTQIPRSSVGPVVDYSSQETAQAMEVVHDGLLFCGARDPDDPATTQQIQNMIGGNGYGRRQENVELPPYIVSVGAERVSRSNVGSRIETGAYGRSRQESEWVGRVRIEVREKKTEAFSSHMERIGTGTAFGRETVGRALTQRGFGGIYSNRQDTTSTPYYAVLHGTVAAFNNIHWSKLPQFSN